VSHCHEFLELSFYRLTKAKNIAGVDKKNLGGMNREVLVDACDAWLEVQAREQIQAMAKLGDKLESSNGLDYL